MKVCDLDKYQDPGREKEIVEFENDIAILGPDGGVLFSIIVVDDYTIQVSSASVLKINDERITQGMTIKPLSMAKVELKRSEKFQ